MVPVSESEASIVIDAADAAASTVPASKSPASIVIDAADAALYQAKDLGRDRIQVYQADPASAKTNGAATPVRPVDFSRPTPNLPSPTRA